MVWDSHIEGHTEKGKIKQLWFSGVCLTVCSPELSKLSSVCTVYFSILNTGPKAIGIGAQGTSLSIVQANSTKIIGSNRLTSGETGKLLPQTFLVDRGMDVKVLADFGFIPKFTEAFFVLQAKRILAPQISFQIPFLNGFD